MSRQVKDAPKPADMGAVLGLFAHDLRNPLSALRSNLGFVVSSGGELDPDVREALEDSSVSCESLLRIIDNVEVLARDLRDEELAKDGVSAATLLDEALARHQTLAASHSVNLAVDPGPRDKSPWLAVNAGAAATALSNLLCNAIQHTGSGGSVRAELVVNGDQCIIRVQDGGAALQPEDAAIALSLLGQLSAKREGRARYSYGLGLYSARRAAELAGGLIRLGTAETGNVFELVLPVGGG